MALQTYSGSALYVRWEYGPDLEFAIELSAESRSFTVDEEASEIEVTVRSDSAQATLTDRPTITATLSGLDTSGTSLATDQAWDTLTIGDLGAVVWGPEGTATGRRKRALAARLQNKKFASPYDGAVAWELTWSGDSGQFGSGGTVITGFTIFGQFFPYTW